jgi:hypothetical protein
MDQGFGGIIGRTRAVFLALAVGAAFAAPAAGAPAQVPPPPAAHDGAHDFDFLIGEWKAHVRRLPDRLVGSTKWVEYDGISNHHKLLDSDANFEEFEVRNAAGDHLKAQTLRLYNPVTHQWSIYLVDLAAGTIGLPPMTGRFVAGPEGALHGEFYDQEDWKGRAVIVRFQWFNLTPKAARMEQAFSPDGGRTWETNWICELSR